MSLNQSKWERYSRQMVLMGFGENGQKKLASRSVLVIGAGGLGSSCSYYLAAAGVGTMGLADNDQVAWSNLNRQILHREKDVGRDKVASAAEALNAFNPGMVLKTFNMRVDETNLAELIEPFDFIIDATDNFFTKYLISDTCVRLCKPFSHAGVSGLRGQVFTYVPAENAACCRCLFPEPSGGVVFNEQASGIIGAVAGVIGSVQALEAVKYLTQTGELLVNRLWIFDGEKMETRIIPFAKRRSCPGCSDQTGS